MRERPDLTDDSVLSSLHVSLILLLLAIHLYHVLTILAFVPLLSSRVLPVSLLLATPKSLYGTPLARGGHVDRLSDLLLLRLGERNSLGRALCPCRGVQSDFVYSAHHHLRAHDCCGDMRTTESPLTN